MPPRKRAASAPKDEPEQEPLAPDASTEPDDDADVSAPAADDPDKAPGDTDDANPDNKPERSDLQTADMPCQECCPNGWPEGAFSVGCTHGTYVRKQN